MYIRFFESFSHFIHTMIRILLSVIFSFAMLAGCSQSPSSNAPSTVPEFTFFVAQTNQPVMRTSLAIEGNTVFIFFDTGCIHCRNEMVLMGDNFDQFKNATFYLVSQQDKGIVDDFMNTYGQKIKDKPNVHVLLDRNYEFLAKFKPVQYPAMYVYGPDRKLKTYLDGENDLNTLISAINN